MHSKKYLLRMLINSYVFALVVFGIILVLGTFAYVSIGHYNMVKAGMDTLSNYLRIALFFCLLLLGLFIAFMMESYDMFGQVFIF